MTDSDSDPPGTEYRVEFSITRRLPDEDDFTEIGFGSSGAWESVEQANHMAASAIDRPDSWERPWLGLETS